ncbi:MAG: STAS domain-containing protein [Chloroherpetonaceae bacterium]|nr:STAS domain-containing protein [Chloroherpetonaceae bacterium]MDW8437046.1 STAS domain-containing protein [Chloroherpetonaceae bacterium]
MATFNASVRESGKTSVIDVSGDLDAHTAVQLERVFEKLISEQRANIVVNFSNLNYISSAGLGVFMAFIDEVRSKGGDIKFANMPEKIYQIFDLLGFPSLYEIYDDEKKAIEKFQTNAS